MVKIGYEVLTIVRMHFVHNNRCTLRPFSMTDTVCRFGRKIRRVAFFDQGRL
jgi:hypothetical protein